MDIFGSAATATALVASAATAGVDTFTNAWALVALAVGIPLGFYVISRLIGLVPGHRGSRRS
jgi:divalent metal cation (Fe/Co/Zn/Cd) transporter